LKAELSDDAVDAALADGEAALTQLLGNNFRGGIAIEKTMPNDLADKFFGAAVVGLGTALLAQQAQGSLQHEGDT
jgi:hypothetical protein